MKKNLSMKKPIFISLTLLLLSQLTAYAGDITLPPVADWIKFTTPVQSSGMSLAVENNASGEGYTQMSTVDGVPCRKIPAGKFMYLTCDRSAVPSTARQLILTVTYYDNSMNYLWMNYTRSGTGWGGADFKKTNTKKWITRIIVLNDAGLDGSMGYGGDIRMGFGSEDNYISDISVYVGTLNPDAQPIPSRPNNPASEFRGKSFAGYQLWHEAGNKPEDWRHWSYGKLPAAGRGNHNTETFPYLADYQGKANVTLYPTNFANLGNGNPASLYNATDKGVIDIQMSLLQKAGFDGVAIQRNAPVGRDMKYTSTDDYYVSIRNACEKNGRSFYVMYCMPDINNGSQSPEDLVEGIKRDWVYQMEQIYSLTSSPAYATVNGKPVVELWGLGYSTILVNKPQALALAQFFKERGCYVIAGVPRDWRLRNEGSRSDFEEVYRAYDMLSPWTVGAYSDAAGSDSYRSNYMAPDKAYCDQYGIGYYPVIFPGSGWSQHVSGYPNDTKRNGGYFLWNQARNIKSIGASSMYFAMLDEFEESTNIISAAADYFDLPTDQYFGTLSMDGTWTSPDYYLRLAGAAARMLTSSTAPMEIPIAYSNGPLYYRNSFESRVANCIINGTPQDIVSPIDACFYQNALVSSHAVSNATTSIVNEPVFAKSGAYSVKINGSASGTADYYYRISTTRIPVKANMQLSFWKYSVNAQGRYTSVDLAFKSGRVLHELPAYKDNNGNPMHPNTGRGAIGTWEKFTCQIGKGELLGDEITGIIIAYSRASSNGNFNAYFDDIIIEDAVDADTATTTPAPIGSIIWLMNNSKYVCSENGVNPMNCNRDALGPWEQFEVVDGGNGTIALKGNNGLYVTSGSPMYCNGTSINSSTRFNWVKTGNNSVALLSQANQANLYACSENGEASMNCNRTAIGEWETFTWGIVNADARQAAPAPVKATVTPIPSFNMYPNPATENVIIDYELKNQAQVVIDICNLQGGIVKSLRKFSTAGAQRVNIPVNELTPGMYLVRISANGGVETKKLFIF
jgi:hypothetical protein